MNAQSRGVPGTEPLRGQRCDDAADFGNAAIDAFDEFVDRTGKALQVGIVVRLGDALGEIAGSGGRDDIADRGL